MTLGVRSKVLLKHILNQKNETIGEYLRITLCDSIQTVGGFLKGFVDLFSSRSGKYID